MGNCSGCYGIGSFHTTGCSKNVRDICGRCKGTGKYWEDDWKP